MNQKSLKSTMRQQFLDRRLEMSPEKRKAASAQAYESFFKRIRIEPDAIVAGYWPVRAELDVLPIMLELISRGHICCLPFIPEEEKSLVFRTWTPTSPMVIGKYGIAVPAAEAPEVVPDVMLVPMAAFDKKGYRIGYGAGLYDRTIPHIKTLKPHALAVGFAYEEQNSPEVPVDDHDVKMDMIITDRNIYQ